LEYEADAAAADRGERVTIETADVQPVYGELLFTQLWAVDKGHDNVISTEIG
jgi:hypothetical protein